MTLKVIQGHPHQVRLIKTMVQINEIANESFLHQVFTKAGRYDGFETQVFTNSIAKFTLGFPIMSSLITELNHARNPLTGVSISYTNPASQHFPVSFYF